VEPRGFFYAGHSDVVLDCYRLAKFYSRDPDEFLAKPISAIERHIMWTGKMLDAATPPET
jgi:hypothetical protein